MTTKQRLTASKLVENGGNIGKAMKEAGYSPATAKTPKKLTGSKGWAILMAEVLPDENLIRTHQGLLGSYKLGSYTFPVSMDDKFIKKIFKNLVGFKVIRIEVNEKNKICFFVVPDYPTRRTALELAYRIKGRLTISDPDEINRKERMDAFFDNLAASLPN